MKTSEQINEIATALAKAQAEIKNPTKDSVNPHFKSRYVDLASGIDAVRAVLSKNGISIIQAPTVENMLITLETRLAHSSGQWISCTYPVIQFPARQQEIGSAITYARRYSLFGLVGIAGDDDDDGNEANKTRIEAPKVAAKPETPPIDLKDSKIVYDALAQSLIMAQTVAEADQWMSDNLEAINGLHDDHKALLRRSIKEIRQSLAKAA